MKPNFRFDLGFEWICPIYGDKGRVIERIESERHGLGYKITWNDGDDSAEVHEDDLISWTTPKTEVQP